MRFLPILYPDELFSSVIARYSTIVGIGNRGVNKLIYGKNLKVELYFVKELRAFMQRNNFHLDEVKIVEEHTLLPYFKSVLTKDKYEYIRQKMILDKDNKHLSFEMELGMIANRQGLDGILRYCNLCYKENISQYGTAYWHRKHQLPGVFYCPIHKCYLNDIEFNYKNRKNQYVMPDINNLLINPNELPKSYLIDKRYSQFIDISNQLLVGKAPNIKDPQSVKNNYKELLRSKGLLTINGNLKREKIKKKIVEYFGIDFLKEINYFDFDNEKQIWIDNLNRKNNLQVIEHILWQMFLNRDFKQIYNQKYIYEPFGKGPWPCLNKICDSYQALIIRSVEIKMDGKSKKIVGTFKCTQCGYTYVIGINQDENSYDLNKARIIDFGHKWRSLLLKYINQGINQRQISLKMHCSPGTINNNAKKLGYEKCEDGWRKTKNVSIPCNLDDQIKNEKREEYIQIVNKVGNGIVSARKANPALYAWLYRNDRKWLNEHNPRRLAGNCGGKRIDYNRLDIEILEQVRSIVEEILIENKKVRITTHTLFKNTSSYVCYEKKLELLTNTNQYIKKYAETHSVYRKRFINGIIGKMQKNGEHILKDNIKVAAGFRRDYFEEAWEAMTYVHQLITVKSRGRFE
ncbi:TnsD family Tn7-like transposition protein [Bacillus sp. D386]|uniref:TnsD family Tn7-like transposition protein n=1 Tax=Bacillus sp. D386 TaxID=2587155 RepID=UPI00111DFD98|nr:TnsD family Tn7-like transposition protein [Bacillus sp. D386]